MSSFAFMLNAQSKSDRKPIEAPWISKDVVRAINKEARMIPRLTVKSIAIPDAVISKEVQKQKKGDRNAERLGNVVSSGYPDWIVSKSVARINK